MKKSLFSLAILLSLAFSSFAQQAGDFAVGPKFGIGASFLQIDNDNVLVDLTSDEILPAPVFNVGITGDYFILNLLSIGGTVGYRQRGYVEEYGNVLSNNTFQLWNYNHYVGLDIIPKIHLGTSTSSIYVGLGPRMDFFMGNSVYGGDDDNLQERETKDEMERRWNDSNNSIFGISAVVGISATPRSFFEIEYTSDLSKSNNDDDSPAFQVINANIGLRF